VNRSGCVRKGCLGCLGGAGAGLVLLLLVWLVAPGLIDGVVDWALYVEAPAVQITPGGEREIKRALTGLYTALEGDHPAREVILSEGAINDLLTAPSDGSALQDARVDLTDGAAILYAGIDLERAAAHEEYGDLLADVPAFLRDRRVSVRVELEGVTTAHDRLNFENIDVKVGRIWVPFSGAWALPILQRMAESKLGTRLPEKGLPLPPGSSATIANEKLTIAMSAARR
jgi:hypothetical protein